MFESWCGPEHCGFGGWLYDYQNFVAGLFALVAGVGAYFAGHASARATTKASADQIAANKESKEEDARSIASNVYLAYSSQFHALCSALDDLLVGPEFDDGALSHTNVGVSLEVATRHALQMSQQCWLSMQTVPLRTSGEVVRGLLAFDEFVAAVEVFRNSPFPGGLLRSGHAQKRVVTEQRNKAKNILKEISFS